MKHLILIKTIFYLLLSTHSLSQNTTGNVEHVLVSHQLSTKEQMQLYSYKNLKTLSLFNFKDSSSLLKLDSFPQLTALYIVDSDLKRIPNSFKYNKSIEKIYILRDSLLNIQQTLDVLSTFKNIKELHIEGIPLNLTELNFSKLKTLEYLSLRGDGLTEVPLGISQIKGLRTLDIGYNPIETLPVELSNLSKLETLYIDHDQKIEMTSSTKIIRSLPNLKYIHVEENNMDGLYGLEKVPQLRNIFITQKQTSILNQGLNNKEKFKVNNLNLDQHLKQFDRQMDPNDAGITITF